MRYRKQFCLGADLTGWSRMSEEKQDAEGKLRRCQDAETKKIAPLSPPYAQKEIDC